MRIRSQLIALILSCFTVTTLFANETKKEVRIVVEEEHLYQKARVVKEQEKPMSWWSALEPVLSFRGGFDYAKVGGQTGYVKLADNYLNANEYVPDDKWHTTGVWGFLLGFEFPINEDFRWQTGVSYYDTGHFKIAGQMLQLGDPAAGNLNYNYQVRNERVLWENKLFTELNGNILLYFLMGIGASWNKASDFEENNDPNPYTFTDPPFGDKTVSSFTYSFGFGFEFPVWRDFRAGIGYQYSDLGKVELGTIEDQLTDDTINFDSTPTHEVLLSLTYLF